MKDLPKSKQFETVNPHLNDKMIWRKTWNGEILSVGNVYRVGKEFCVYAGDFDRTEDAPKVFCCYTIGDELKVRHIITNPKDEIPLEMRRKRVDDERPIDTTLKDTDNALMVFIKIALRKKKITRGDFRKLYTNVSDMNNVLRCIEKGDSLSWMRFTDLLDRLQLTYNLDVYDNDEIIVSKAL
jgi:hypothetical protein